jgi:hypothetical protein
MQEQRILASLLAALLLGGCGAHKPFVVSDADQKRFADGMITVPIPGHDPLIEGLDDCVVWKAQTAHQDIVGWKAALGADWGGSYPKFMTVCKSESIEYKDRRVLVSFCAQAIGAGGGCANGGDYWSATGERPWRVSYDGKHWMSLPL